jgi:predicted acetyltransferase
MAYLDYGTADYYAEGFSDYLADIDAKDPETTKNLIEGFYRALDSWFEYHDEQARAYADIRKRVRQALTV